MSNGLTLPRPLPPLIDIHDSDTDAFEGEDPDEPVSTLGPSFLVL